MRLPCSTASALAELVAHLLVAEIVLPEQLAVHVVGVQPARVEGRVDALAVGERRGRGVGAVLLVRRLVRRVLARRLAPTTTLPVLRSIAMTTNLCGDARLPPRRCARRDLDAGGHRDSTKTLSPQITGDAEPRPGISIFQRMFFVSLHSSGGSRSSTRRSRAVRATAASTFQRRGCTRSAHRPASSRTPAAPRASRRRLDTAALPPNVGLRPTPRLGRLRGPDAPRRSLAGAPCAPKW